MPNVLQTDEHAYRACILYEALHKKPVKDAYENMKKVMPTLDHSDFEYWFNRFSNGNHDLNHDRSTDPKDRELSDMPIDVVEKIVGNLDAFSRLSLRKVSRSLRSAVDRKRTQFEWIRLTIGYNDTALVIGEHESESAADQSLQYELARNRVSFVKVNNFFKNKQTIRKKPSSVNREIVVKDLLTLLKNPNWTCKCLRINLHSYEIEFWLELFKSLVSSSSSTSKFNVKELYIDNWNLESMVNFLPSFNSNVLKKIRFEISPLYSWRRPFFDMKSFRRILKMDQWKNAEELYFEDIPIEFDIRNLFHAKKFTIQSCSVSEKRLLAIRDNLLKSATVGKCFLGGKYRNNLSFDQVKNALSQDPAFNNENWRYRVDGADHYYQIEYEDGSLDIQKIMI